jgi:cyclophilin family peptidyl-prolyl cis-trans isomerase
MRIDKRINGMNSEDELSPELRFTGAGILAMANSGPDSNGRFLTTCIIWYA